MGLGGAGGQIRSVEVKEVGVGWVIVGGGFGWWVRHTVAGAVEVTGSSVVGWGLAMGIACAQQSVRGQVGVAGAGRAGRAVNPAGVLMLL